MGGLRIGGLRIFRGGGVQFCFVFQYLIACHEKIEKKCDS